MSEDMDMNALLKVTQNTAMSVSGLSEQMGIVVNRVNENTKRIVALEDRVANHERTETINRAQQRQMRKAVINQVNNLLKIEYEGGKVAEKCIGIEVRYRGGFISRLYTDAKNHSKMGASYSETLKVDYEEVMDYIKSWEPEVNGGTEGYKRYLDIRREERKKKEGR